MCTNIYALKNNFKPVVFIVLIQAPKSPETRSDNNAKQPF